MKETFSVLLTLTLKTFLFLSLHLVGCITNHLNKHIFADKADI